MSAKPPPSDSDLGDALDELLRFVAHSYFSGKASLSLSCNQGRVTAKSWALEATYGPKCGSFATLGPGQLNPRWHKTAHDALREVLRRIRERRITGLGVLRMDWNQGGLRAVRILVDEVFGAKEAN